jgi:hypothetical protein
VTCHQEDRFDAPAANAPGRVVLKFFGESGIQILEVKQAISPNAYAQLLGECASA